MVRTICNIRAYETSMFFNNIPYQKKLGYVYAQEIRKKGHIQFHQHQHVCDRVNPHKSPLTVP